MSKQQKMRHVDYGKKLFIVSTHLNDLCKYINIINSKLKKKNCLIYLKNLKYQLIR